MTTDTTEAQRQPSTLARIVNWVAVVPITLYGVYATLVLLLWLITGERLWFIELFVNLMPGFFYPLVLTVPIALILRKRAALALQALPFAMFLVLYLGMWLPNNTEIPDGQQLRVMTYNVLFVSEDYDGIVDIIRTVDADIVALQEVPSNINDGLRERLADDYPYWEWNTGGNNIESRLTISRYPITNVKAVSGSGKELIFLITTIDVDGTAIEVYNIHPSRPFLLGGYSGFSADARTAQITDFMTYMRQSKSQLPLIIMGDFNMSDQTADYRRLNRAYVDSFAVAGQGFGTTFENYNWLSTGWFDGNWIPQPVRLDYIFLRDGVGTGTFTPIESYVVRDGRSDHLPVVTTLIVQS